YRNRAHPLRASHHVWRILLAGSALIAAIPRPAAAAWAQDRFTIGAWMGENTGHPWVSFYRDTSEMRRLLKMAADLHLNELMMPSLAYQDVATARAYLKVASAYGIRLRMKITSPVWGLTPDDPGGSSAPEWNAFAGY